MDERILTYGSGYFLAFVAAISLLLIIPSASAATRWLRPAWRAWVWPLIFATLALTSLCAALATMWNIQDTTAPLWKAVNLLAGLGFTLLALNTLYRAIPDTVAVRFAPVVWCAFGAFSLATLNLDSFLPVLFYNILCAVLVFAVYSTLYARNRDRAADALPIMIGTGLILLADLLASFEFVLAIGPVRLNQLFPFNLIQILALIFFFTGASASYSVKYDLQRSRERALTGQ